MKKILLLIKNSIDIKKILMASIAISFILIASSIFYYLVVYIPHQNYIKQQQQIEKEKQQAEKEKQQAEKKVEKKQECKDSLDTCLNAAYEDYKNEWASACKLHAETVKNGYQSCIKMGNSPNFCFSLWGKPNPSPDCLLSGKQADSFYQAYKDEKEGCYKDYSMCVK